MSLAALYARGGTRLAIGARRLPVAPLLLSQSPALLSRHRLHLRPLHASPFPLRRAPQPNDQSAIDAGFLPFGDPEHAPPHEPGKPRLPLITIVLVAAGILAMGVLGALLVDKDDVRQKEDRIERERQEKIKKILKERLQQQQQQQPAPTNGAQTSQSLTSLPRAHSAAAETEQALRTEPPPEVQQANTARLAQLHSDARSIFEAALAAADPHRMVLSSLSLQPHTSTGSNDDAAASTGGPAFDLVVSLAPGRALHYDLAHFRRVVVVGAGKAATAMAAGVEEVLAPAEGALTEGLVVTKYGHAAAGPPLRSVRVLEAAHPVPDEAGIEATRQVGQLLDKYSHDPNTLLLVLLSGGGSALWTAPEAPLTLRDIQGVNRALIHSGMPIGEINSLRKHLDQLKGGGFVRRAGQASVLALVLSDVIGDDMDVIASGPTVPFQRDFLRALSTLDKYNLRPSRAQREQRRPDDEQSHALPLRAYEALLQGAKTQMRQVHNMSPASAAPPLLEFDSSHPGAPAAAATSAGAGAAAFSNVTNVLVGSNRHSLDAAARRARELGYDAHVLTDRLDGEAVVAAEWLARAAIPVDADPRAAAPVPRAWIAGGETTVTFAPSSGSGVASPSASASPPGLGGRAQEFALAAAAHIHRHELVEGARGECRTVVLAGGSDGTDGPTNATGAVVDARTWSLAHQAGIDGANHLRRHDSYNFFSQLDATSSAQQKQAQQQPPATHLKPGPTGTNVGDIYLALSR